MPADLAVVNARVHTVDPAAPPGSGKIPDPRRYATIEGCGEVRDATLAFDIGVRRGSEIAWFATDRGETKFRIARGGCFRGGAPLPDGVSPSDIAALRIRAYTRPVREGERPLPPGTDRHVAAMYEAKAASKNCVKFAAGPPPADPAHAEALNSQSDSADQTTKPEIVN